MMQHPLEKIGAWADGELSTEEARAVEAHLRTCTECTRELALIRALGGEMKAMAAEQPDRSVWRGVNRRITRPLGWLLVVAGVVIWCALAALEWSRARELTAEWLSTSALVIGGALLLVSVGYEQYREWKDSPYKDVQQ
jgi:anti-sigma factor RsiW